MEGKKVLKFKKKKKNIRKSFAWEIIIIFWKMWTVYNNKYSQVKPNRVEYER